MKSTVTSLALLVLAASAATAACNAPPEPGPDPAVTQKPAATAPKPVITAKPAATTPRPPPQPVKHGAKAQPVATVPVSEDDPLKGKWTLDDAVKGLPKGDLIVASIETDLGTLECNMFADKAPITVANFVGLARGVRPWKTPAGKWEKKAAYDGTIFHRIIKGFMIQGGDALGTGAGEAGYVIPDEIWEGATHDRPGLLCMANRGANTNSAQFFITDEAAYHLDFDDSHGKPRGGYTIFGECGPVEMVHKLASVKMKSREQPEKPPVIKKVTITRKAAPPAASASASASASAAPSGTPAASAAPTAAASGTPTAKPAPTSTPK